MKIGEIYKNVINEVAVSKPISVKYLKWLVSQHQTIKDRFILKFLNGWIKRGSNGFVTLSNNEMSIYDKIKNGTLKSTSWGTKN